MFSAVIRAVLGGVLLASSWVALAATPTEQNAIVQAGTGGAETLTYKKVPVLEPGEKQVLVKVYAAAVNPFDWKVRTGIVSLARPGGPPTGEGQARVTAPTPENTRIPGSEVAGVIEKVGPGVTQFKVGDAVFASMGFGGGSALNGGYAEYALASVDNVVAKPKTMTFAQAAGLSSATGAGLQAVNRGNVSAGQRVLIGGAAGGVGSAVLQIVKARGAHVIAIASGRHAEYLKKLGADEFYDYTKVAWQDKVSNVDVVIDTVSAENAVKAIKTLKKGGKLVSINGHVDNAECVAAGIDCGGNQTGGPPAAGPPGATGMAEVVKLVNEGKFVINVDRTFPLAKAFDAQEENRNGGTQGKIILVVDVAQANKK